MDVLLILAVVAFLSAAIVAAIQKSWVLVLLCAGLALMALSASGLINT